MVTQGPPLETQGQGFYGGWSRGLLLPGTCQTPSRKAGLSAKPGFVQFGHTEALYQSGR